MLTASLLPADLHVLGLVLDGELVLADGRHAALVLPDHLRKLILVLLQLRAQLRLVPGQLPGKY